MKSGQYLTPLGKKKLQKEVVIIKKIITRHTMC